jgi:hypothetical protein
MILGEAWFYALAFVVTAGLLFSSVYFVACIPVAGYWRFVSSKEGVFWVAVVGRVRMKKKNQKKTKSQKKTLSGALRLLPTSFCIDVSIGTGWPGLPCGVLLSLFLLSWHLLLLNS